MYIGATLTNLWVNTMRHRSLSTFSSNTLVIKWWNGDNDKAKDFYYIHCIILWHIFAKDEVYMVKEGF